MAHAEALYLDLLKNCLTRYTFDRYPRYREVQPPRRWLKRTLYPLIRKALTLHNLVLAKPIPYDAEARAEGHEWPPPAEAETMIGLKGLDNLQFCITDVLQRNTPGDFLEAGVWRGGAAVFMRGVLKAYDESARIVWVADSFQGWPEPDPIRCPADAGHSLWTASELVVGIDEVKANFKRYGLLDAQVRFLCGWFRETLPTAPIERLAILRIDSDLYESTMDALQYLYHKLSVGGYIIIDDYYGTPGCQVAVDEFRAAHGINEEMQRINWEAVFWQKRR